MKFAFFYLLTLMTFNASANHFLAGEMYYSSIGNNNYEFNVIFYRDCFTSGANFDDSIHFTVFDQSNNLLQNITALHPGLNQVFNSSFSNSYNINCFTVTEDTCIEYVIYTAIINLPPINGGYNVSYQRCCSEYDVLNVNNSNENGFTLISHIPGIETGNQINSSPHFSNHSPFVLCDNSLTQFNHSATDIDGDSLVYSIIPAITGASALFPAPTASSPPPYLNFGWSAGYSLLSPLGLSSSFTIDSNTGLISTTPNGPGLYILAIKVEEFRNGISLGSTIRNLTLKVLDANASITENKNDFSIPNPTRGFIDLTSIEKVSKVRVFNITGQLIYEKTNPGIIDFQRAPKGTYFVELNIDGNISFTKLIKN